MQLEGLAPAHEAATLTAAPVCRTAPEIGVTSVVYGQRSTFSCPASGPNDDLAGRLRALRPLHAIVEDGAGGRVRRLPGRPARVRPRPSHDQHEYVAQLAELRRQAESRDAQSKTGSLKKEADKIRREIDRLVNALARTDEKPDSLVKAIADRQERLRDVDGQLRAAETTPALMEHYLDRIARRAREAIEDIRGTFEHQPEKTRELVGTLFGGRIMFRPMITSDGPRFELEAPAAPGRLLAVEDLKGIPKLASPAGVEPALAT